MRLAEIKKLMKEEKEFLKLLEEYDRTGILGLTKKMKTFTLNYQTLCKLKEIARKTNRNMSQVIEDLVEEKD